MPEPHKPTNRQIKELKKALREQPGTKIVILQRRPYTVAIVKARIEARWYVDFGFSKVDWPDWFIPSRGAEIAAGRAFDSIAERILGIGSGLSLREEHLTQTAMNMISEMEDELNPLLVGS